MQQAIYHQEETRKKFFQSGVIAGINLERMKTAMEISQLDRMTLMTFVKRVLVYEDKRVYLELRCKELFSKYRMLADDAKSKKQSGGEAV